MARNDYGIVRGPVDIRLGGTNCAVNAAASPIVDEWEIPVPPRVSNMQDIFVNKLDGDVGICVGWSITFRSAL